MTILARLAQWLRLKRPHRTYIRVDRPPRRWHTVEDNHASVDVSKRIQSEWRRGRW